MSSRALWLLLLFSCHLLFAKGIRVKVTDEHGQSIKSKYRSLPGKLKADVTLEGENVGLTLDRNLDHKENLPLFVLRTDQRGNEVFETVQTNLNVTLYQDVENGASFGIVHKQSKTGSHFKILGLVHKGSKVYELTSTSALRHEGDDVSEEFALRVHDNPPSRDQADSRSHPLTTLVADHGRNKRAVTQDVHVDVVALADYGVYQAWYKRSDGSTATEKKQNALASIYEYYALIYNGVNMMYRSITTLHYVIHTKLTAIIVATDAQASPWTELGRQSRPGSEYDVTNASAALNNLTEWAGNHGNNLPPYDLIQLSSGYDLTNDDGNTVTTGVSETSTLCLTNGSASSVIEDLGGFHCVNTAAHEIGHTLSANHDGFENNCDSGDGYIMSSGLYTITETNKRNRWMWSTCSVKSFDDFFQGLSHTAHGRDCMYTEEQVRSEVPDVSSMMPGQIYNVDQQCQQIHGANASFCRGINIVDWSNICTAMWCLKPLTNNYCGREVAARGTTCADGKWCIDGDCVIDSRAPATPDHCTLPDQPGLVSHGQTCSELVKTPNNCNNDYILLRCCKACATVVVPPRNITQMTSGQIHNVDQQCEVIYGSGSVMCRGIDIGDASNICGSGSLWCLKPATDGFCGSETAIKETTCGDHKWCIGGHCVHDNSAPAVTDGCPFPDEPDLIANDMNCTELMTHTPRKCYQEYVSSRCCKHCAATTIPTQDPNHTPAAQMLGQLHDVDAQCQQIQGPQSSFCRGMKLNNVSDVCSSMWCLRPNGFCNPEVADDGTTCGDHMWCIQGQCTHNGHAPAVVDGCPLPDQPGVVSNGMTCAQLMADGAARHCGDSYVIARCCKACAAATHTSG